MKCILLCAGYATRLFPLTEKFPKALLEIGGNPLLDYTLDKINEVEEIDEIYLISNDRYFNHFNDWASSKNSIKPITVINDLTVSVDDRLGAIGDLIYTIDKMNITDDILVMAGDAFFTYNLTDMIEFYKDKKAPMVAVEEINDVDVIKAFAVLKMDDKNIIKDIEEKPVVPKSNLAAWATYIYPKEILGNFNDYKELNLNMDAPGNFLVYLHKVMDVYGYVIDGTCYDVGTHKALKEVNTLFIK